MTEWESAFTWLNTAAMSDTPGCARVPFSATMLLRGAAREVADSVGSDRSSVAHWLHHLGDN